MTRVEEIERTWEDAGCPEGDTAELLREIQWLQKENILLWELTRPIRESTITNRLEAIDQRTVGHPFGFVEVLRPDYNWLRWKASGAEKAEAEIELLYKVLAADVAELGGDWLLEQTRVATANVKLQDEVERLRKRIERGRDYAMRIEENEITAPDILEVLGYSRDGMTDEEIS